MELVAYIGKDEENWGQITALIKKGKWDKVILVKNKEIEGFPDDGCESISIKDGSIIDMKDEIMGELKPMLTGDFEVALSIASGSGKEHMAIISALINIPVGIKLAVYTKNGVQFIS